MTMDFDVGQRLEIDFERLKCWTTLRGWVPDKILLVDLPRVGRGGDLIRKGMECRIRYVVPDGIRFFSSRVQEIVYCDPPMIYFQYPAEISRKRLRSELRVKTHFHVWLARPQGEGNRAVVVDLSRRGCLVEAVGMKLELGEELVLGGILPNHVLFAKVPCVVRRLQDHCLIGLEFGELSEEQEQNLELCLGVASRPQPEEQGESGGQAVIGDLQSLSLGVLAQLVGASGRAYELEVWDEPRTGKLYFDHGLLVHASVGSLKGEQAFYEMMRWAKGQFCLSPAREIPHRNVFHGLIELLSEVP